MKYLFAVIVYVQLLSPARSQILSTFITEIEKHKAQLFDYELTDWNKTIRSHRKCRVSDKGKIFNAAVYYDKDNSMVKFKIMPDNAARRMQICFLKSNDLYIGKAYSATDDDTIEQSAARKRPPRPPVGHSKSVPYTFFENIYLYVPGSNELFAIHYTDHPGHNDTFGADYEVQQLRSHIIAIYRFKADLLGGQKYIEPVSAIGIFGLEPRRFDFTEARRMVPIIYAGAPHDEYYALRRDFCRDSAIVTNAYYIDPSTKTAYETNISLDSLLQFDLVRMKDRNILRSAVPVNTITIRNNAIKFPVSFDIPDASRSSEVTRTHNSIW